MTQEATTTKDPYSIRLHGINLTVYPKEDGTYDVYKESRQIAQLYPGMERNEVVWESTGWIDEDYINEIGKKIEEQNLTKEKKNS